jgi:putative FmdB family regulatory protein
LPTYQYACTECGHGFEAVQSFTDDALTECPQCAGRLRKVFNSVGIVFKGSGFYRTDSREKAGAVAGGKDGVQDSSAGAKADGKTTDGKNADGKNADGKKSDSPAAAAAASTASGGSGGNGSTGSRSGAASSSGAGSSGSSTSGSAA